MLTQIVFSMRIKLVYLHKIIRETPEKYLKIDFYVESLGSNLNRRNHNKLINLFQLRLYI